VEDRVETGHGGGISDSPPHDSGAGHNNILDIHIVRIDYPAHESSRFP
jgi:hypothetical protein